ncbi:LacI family DNA-binding transcriptional regulator [Horticoccus sp. 23ND18S-11]|uniref:LacI family DNA-binding transcriptional regulator n=1 Tax=Horticoccus sp. 23ND18S-11 TaxID=3391832 RepID=UPI0039C948CC
MLITEIAKKAKVSPATVSRAINQPQIVAPDSLARIRSVMEAHNYVPAPLNRRRGPKVRMSEQRRVGVWFVGARASNPSHNWFQDELLQVQSNDTRYRVDLRVLFSNSPHELPAGLATEKLDGLIIQGMEPAASCLTKLGDLPYVWFMTRRSASFAGDYVEPNNEENGRMAADYLVQQGHKVAAVISTDPDYSAVARRVKAFAERAAELKLPVHLILGKSNPGVSYLEYVPVHSESDTLVRTLLAATPRATGLYLPIDHFCGSFFRGLREAGRRPERDFEVVLGNYNPVIYHNLDHLPAAIDINLPTLVRKVVDHLIWRIENRTTVGRIGVTVSPSLRLPESNGHASH